MSRIRPVFLLLGSLVLPACSLTDAGDASGTAVDEELFITAYVELRTAALLAPGQELSLEARDRVLEEVGVGETDLLDFVEVHGKDLQFMRRVWEKVDSVMEERRRPRGGGDEPG